LTRQDIIATFARRLKNRRADEIAECLRQIKRIAEMRLNDLLDVRWNSARHHAACGNPGRGATTITTSPAPT
jgi:hypothetical protein